MAADFVSDDGVPSADPDGPYHLEIPMAAEFSCAYRFKELLREIKRTLDRSIREIERERQGLQNQEKKLIIEIKKSAKLGQMVRYASPILFSSKAVICNKRAICGFSFNIARTTYIFD
ncbi:uncharacterized protein A4U43_C05F26980 [Asparagus officinalis]|uniref:Uncharacterized protein n=1 Tax=Asparagus officinalis TaxID=4686 RepID=A0A5P1F059_ASPOF|nr:uncharacterized protein A4U43_C05F26980 [Asparagus officinalis]